MNLDQLRYFVAVAEELHFRRAAERLRISQPPLSFHIKALEAEVGTVLLNRTSRQVSLTEAGVALLEKSRKVLAAVAEAERAVKDVQLGKSGQLRISFTMSTTFYSFFYNSVFEYRRSYPGVAVTLHEMVSGKQIEDLQAGRIDIGFLRAPFPTAEAVKLLPLVRDELVIALHKSHPLANSRQIALADLRQDAFISYPASAGVGIYRQFLRLCEQAGFQPRIAQEALEPSVIIGLVAANLGVAIVPSALRDIRINDVLFKPIRDQGTDSTLHLAWRSGDRSPRVEAFRSLVRSLV